MSMTASAPVPAAMNVNPVERLATEPADAEIAARAYQLYEARGREHGHDLADWFNAEAELRQRAVHAAVPEYAAV